MRGIKVITWDADAEPDARDFFVNQATPEGIGQALMDNAARLCDAVCIIARGEIVLDGPLGEVKARHGGRHVALGIDAANGEVSRILTDPSLVRRVDDSNRYLEVELADGADPQELLRRVVGAGAMVQRFELIQPSLHQIFLDRVGATGVEEGMSGHG